VCVCVCVSGSIKIDDNDAKSCTYKFFLSLPCNIVLHYIFYAYRDILFVKNSVSIHVKININLGTYSIVIIKLSIWSHSEVLSLHQSTLLWEWSLTLYYISIDYTFLCAKNSRLSPTTRPNSRFIVVWCTDNEARYTHSVTEANWS